MSTEEESYVLGNSTASITKEPYVYHHKQVSDWDFTNLDEKEVDELMTHNEKLYRHLVEEFRHSNYLYRRPETVGLIVLYVPVFLLAILGNMVVLLVVISIKHMRSVTNFFIANLAVADLTGMYKPYCYTDVYLLMQMYTFYICSS